MQNPDEISIPPQIISKNTYTLMGTPEELSSEILQDDEELTLPETITENNLLTIPSAYPVPQKSMYIVGEEFSGTIEEDQNIEEEVVDNEAVAFSDSEPEELSEEAKEVAEELPTFLGVNHLPLGSVELTGELGQGAFGKVYRGKWGSHEVALKTIDLKHAQKNFPEMDKYQIRDSLEWEVSRLSTVSHPNCVQFYGVYQEKAQGKTYLAMEFCHGGTLQGALEKQPDLIRLGKGWQWALEMSQGLAYLHDQGVLHRDLKTENILLDKHGCAKLADLGVAQVDALLQKGEAGIVAQGVQDQRFIAPENLTHATLSSKATDVYALGLVFWQMLSGKAPRHPKDISHEEKQKWKRGESGYEREVIPEHCPESFRQLILACWRTDPAQRLSIEEVIKSLRDMGGEFHPEPVIMETCEQIETLIHPKRLEGLKYIEPYLTEHKVTEPIDVYWSHFESTSKARGKRGNSPLDLNNILTEFLNNADTSSLLLLGDSGLGKTLSTYLLADRLMAKWRTHLSDSENKPYLPIFIRPTLKAWSHQELKDGFAKALDFYGLKEVLKKSKIPLLLIVDGYDECQADEAFNQHPQNLSEQLGIPPDANIKLFVTCRPDTVEFSALKERFECKNTLEVKYFLPFNIEQLLQYLNDNLGWTAEEKAGYQVKLTNSAELRTVLRNPFVLMMMAQSWSTAIKNHPYLNNLNRWKIYESAVEHWLLNHQQLLSKSLRKILTGDKNNLLTSFQDFAGQMAFAAFKAHNIALFSDKVKELPSPWVLLKEKFEEDSKAEFAKRRAKLTEEKKRRALLSEEDYINVMRSRLEQFSAGSPLKRRELSHEFSHKSFFEYFMAKHLVLLREKEEIAEIIKSLHCLNTRSLQEEPEVLSFWVEGWREAQTRVLIEPLFGIVESSRKDNSIAQASSNAATLLAVARVSFSGRDLSGVCIPGANLSGAVLSHTSFKGSDLRKVKLKGCYLSDADFMDANMRGISFGEYPTLNLESAVQCVAYSPDQR